MKGIAASALCARFEVWRGRSRVAATEAPGRCRCTAPRLHCGPGLRNVLRPVRRPAGVHPPPGAPPPPPSGPSAVRVSFVALGRSGGVWVQPLGRALGLRTNACARRCPRAEESVGGGGHAVRTFCNEASTVFPKSAPPPPPTPAAAAAIISDTRGVWRLRCARRGTFGGPYASGLRCI